MIDIDILRADALPCYGYKRNTAPNICSLAQKSQLFVNNFTHSNWTLPAMFSTITSLYPSQHGVTTSMRDVLDPNIPTIAQTFKNAGYKTYYFGSLGASVINDTNGGTRGYDLVKYSNIDEWKGVILDLSRSRHPFFVHFYTNSLHMPYILESPSQILEPAHQPSGFPVTKNDFSLMLGRYLMQNRTRLFTPQAIKERPDLFDDQKTFSMDALIDYYWSLYKSTDPELINSQGWRVVYELYVKAINESGVGAGEYARLLYDSTLSILDKNMGPLLALLNTEEFSNNTVLILYSDHGEEFNEHGQYGHMGNLYNEIVKTPLVVFVPEVPPKKHVSLSQNIDIFPTLATLTGVGRTRNIQGLSLDSIVVGSQKSNATLALSQSSVNKTAINDGVWKLIKNSKDVSLDNAELYNMENDPKEKNDVLSLHPKVGILLLNELSKRVPSRQP